MIPDENAPNASLPPTAMDDVRVANARWWDALVAADEGELDALLADDFFYYNPYGGSSTKAEIFENLRSGRLKYHANTYEAPLIRFHSQTAIVTGQAHIDFSYEGHPVQAPLNYTAVYGWTASHWRLLMYQATLRPDAGA